MFLTRPSVDNPQVVDILTAFILEVGLLADVQLGVDFSPEPMSRTAAILVTYRGASAAEMEQLVGKPIEDRSDDIIDCRSCIAEERSRCPRESC